MKYDYLIVGAGLYGAVFAYEARKRGKSSLVIDKRNHVGGNCYTESIDAITVHKYGAHIFHTSDKNVWDYVTGLCDFNNFTNSPIAKYKGRIYNLPFNMNTFYSLWGTVTPEEARNKILSQTEKYKNITPSNLEEQALKLVGEDIYETLIKEYTQKQWGRKCTELPAFIIRRIPLRFTYCNNYFNDKYQGIPEKGYTHLISRLLDGANVKLGTDFFPDFAYFKQYANKLVFTGMIDAFYRYEFGKLEYRSLRFESQRLNIADFQGNAVVNYTEAAVPYTRIIEHKHFGHTDEKHTIITREYPQEWQEGVEPYYPVNDERNNTLYAKIKLKAEKERDVIFGGRLGNYKYYNMDEVISRCLDDVKNEFN